jgi:hypothetical protein
MEKDVRPECTVVFGGGRLQDTGLIDDRRIELTFSGCWFARVAPKDDNEGIDAVGFEVVSPFSAIQDTWERLRQEQQEWQRSGYCPDSGFYVAVTSAWLSDLPEYQSRFKHYVVSGRDGYVELIAQNYAWREWLWVDSDREEAPNKSEVIGEGSSSDDDFNL